RGFATATDLADYLVKQGTPFRDAHEMVGKAVGYGVATAKDLADMTLEEIRQFAPNANQDVFDVLTLEGSVAARDHLGGTAPNQVRAQVKRWQTLLSA
ncbi:MAG TPA: argininosuccinate lyase, partial [Thiotrichales bacterium]|nr:argininosuccinate lyase [Thiotrichales bacterium]